MPTNPITIIAGSRDFDDYSALDYVMAQIDIRPSKILSGGARGADKLGEDWAMMHSVPFEVHKAEWARLGYGAGPVRNQKMADAAQALVAMWDGKSSGTKDMISRARKCGLDVYVYNYITAELCFG